MKAPSGVVGLEAHTLAARLKIISSVQKAAADALIIRAGPEDAPNDGARERRRRGDAGAGCPDQPTSSTWRRLPATTRRKSCSTAGNDVLWRLYHEAAAHGLRPQSVEFAHLLPANCRAGALKTLPDEEIDSIPADEGEIGGAP
ncbi:hypothetical protein MJ579_26585 [Klebsiella pneumoniae]|nr:hypothetical protein MJ579_26585 [Klebsiella pneumoniae]